MFNQSSFTPQRQRLMIYIILAAVTAAVYRQVHHFEFINFDDVIYITENPMIQSGISLNGFYWSFGSKYFGLWNPLVWLSFMVDHQLYGLKAGGYHVTNLILHILSTLLLFWLFCRMTGTVWRSAFVAAFFALHPLHVESVAWVSERKDVLSAFFWMLTLCFYVYYTEKPAIKRYLLIVFSFVLALLSKPMVITLPVIMILLDYWPLRRFESRKGNLFLWQVKEKLPFFILSAVLVIVTLYTPGGQDAFTKIIPLDSRLANAPVAFMTYLAKTFWPHNMAIFYPFAEQIPVWKIAGTFLLIVMISATVIVMAKRLPFLLTGWLWFLITIIPVIGIVQIGDFAMADRYHYLPSIGIAVMLAWGIPHLVKSEPIRNWFLLPAGIGALLFLAFWAWQQCGHWKNSIELWQHALHVTDNNYMAHNNLASALLEKGETRQAMDHYQKAIEINHYPAAYYNTGVIYYRLGQYHQAIEQFKQAIHEQPDYAAAHFNLGFVYHLLGQHDLALEEYNATIRFMPNHANAYNSRAFLYLNQDNSIAGCSNALKACQLGNCTTLMWAKEKRLCVNSP
ncbi:MAG TPA: tetratricopeptide repeat protein [Smithella sp.]|nr:tetratricopeptide repeat protein [Smithella sp.]